MAGTPTYPIAPTTTYGALGVNPIATGGTGATTAAGARTSLGIDNLLLLPATPSNDYYYPGLEVENSNVFVGDGGRQCSNVEDENTVYPLDYYENSHVLGLFNVFVGKFAGFHNIEGNLNTIVGAVAGYTVRNGDQNTYLGAYAAQNNVDGYHNTYLGVGAGQWDEHGYMNVFIGCDNTLNAKAGHHNVGVGTSAGTYNEANRNTYIGVAAMAGGSGVTPMTGDDNTCVGYTSLHNTVSGATNTAIGTAAMFHNTTGSKNVALGYHALVEKVTGDYSIGIGHRAGAYLSDGTTANAASTQCIYIGGETHPASSGRTNEIVIGHGAVGLGDNTVKIGNASTTKTIVSGKLGVGNDSPLYTAGFKATTNNAWIASFETTDAGNAKMLWGVNASGTPVIGVLSVGNDYLGTSWSFYNTGAMVCPGVVTATFHKTSTAITANSSGTVSIVAKDDGSATANAGWLPMKKSDDVTVYVPFWT